MQSIDEFCDTVLTAVRQLPLIQADEGRPYLSVVLSTIEVLKAAKARDDHSVARRVLSILRPLRKVLTGVPLPDVPDAQSAIYLCGVGLKLAGIGQQELDDAVATLDDQLTEPLRSKACELATDDFRKIDEIYVRDENGWRVVDRMIRGADHRSAYIAVQLDDAERKEWNEKAEALLNSRSQQSSGTGYVLPGGGSYLSTPDVTSISFGNKGGKATLVGGKLSILLPSK